MDLGQSYKLGLKGRMAILDLLNTSSQVIKPQGIVEVKIKRQI